MDTAPPREMTDCFAVFPDKTCKSAVLLLTEARRSAMMTEKKCSREEINMAFCTKCGAEMPDDAKVCPSCGAPVPAEETGTADFGAKLAGLNQTEDTTSQFDPADVEKNKVYALLAYIGLLFLVPLLAAPQSRYARYHTNQGVVLFLVELIWGLAFGILNAILSIIPVVWILFSLIGWLVSLGFLALTIIGIVNAVQGRAKELPLIGKIRFLK